jgi:hypothetical protein
LTEIRKSQPRSIDDLRRDVARQLPQLDPALRVVAENIMGLTSPIDLLTVNDRGEVSLILLALEGENDAALLTRSLAQRAWVAVRVCDWAKLAPELELAPSAPVRSILLAPGFGAETRAAALSLGVGIVRLVRYVAVRAGSHHGLLLESVESQGEPATLQVDSGSSPATRAPSGPLPKFRSNLSDADLGLKPDSQHSSRG